MTRPRPALSFTHGPLLGAHVSVAGGVHRAPERGRSIGCDAIQVFTQSPTRWRGTAPSADEARRLAEGCRTHGIRAVIAHGIYLINLAAPDPALWRRSIEAFTRELARCHLLGIGHVVIHPGAHLGKGEDWGLARVTEALDRCLGAQPRESRVTVLLETTAGMGSSLGHRFEHLAAIRRACRAGRRIGYCLDTAHILAAGFEFRTPASYRETLARFDEVCGLAHLHALHLNDSRTARGSRVDRHARVGAGEIGVRPLAWWASDPRLAGRPAVLEIPGGMATFAEDLLALRRQVRRELRRGTHPAL